MYTGILKFENQIGQVVEKVYSANANYPHGSEVRMKIDGEWHQVSPPGQNKMVGFETDNEIKMLIDSKIKNLLACTVRAV